jgi:hypothetical protein
MAWKLRAYLRSILCRIGILPFSFGFFTTLPIIRIRACYFVCLTRASTWRNDAFGRQGSFPARPQGPNLKNLAPFTCPRLAEVLKTTSANPHPPYTEHSI